MSDTLELVEPAPVAPPPQDPAPMDADTYQREAIATAQSEAAHEAALKEYAK